MDYLKIAVLNNSGNVGKSTICDVFLKPRITDSNIISVESINITLSNTNKVNAKDMISVIQLMDEFDKAIIDVGSSNVENFINGIKENYGTHEDIDYYIIPTTTENKQQKDTINTIDDLLDLGVDENKIIVVLNKYDSNITLDRQYKLLNESQSLKSTRTGSLTTCIKIPRTDIFSLLERLHITYDLVISDETDYRTAIREAKDKKTRSVLSLNKSCKRLVTAFNDKLDDEYKKFSTIIRTDHE